MDDEKPVAAETKLVTPMGPPGDPKAVVEYFKSKNDNHLFKKIPDVDLVGREPGLFIWRANNNKIAAQEKLENAAFDHSERRKSMDEKWEELKEKQAAFRSKFEKFNKFMCENEDKIQRTTTKSKENKRVIAEKTADIESKKKSLDELNKICEKMEKQLEKHQIYEDYLKTVIEVNEEFDTPMDVIERFEELVLSKIELSEKQNEKITELLDIVNKTTLAIDNRKTQLMGMNNELASLRIRYDAAKTESKKWDIILKRLISETTKSQSDFSRCKEGLRILYEKICNDKGVPAECTEKDYESQLIMVMRGVEEIRRIAEMAEEKNLFDLASDKVNSSIE